MNENDLNPGTTTAEPDTATTGSDVLSVEKAWNLMHNGIACSFAEYDELKAKERKAEAEKKAKNNERMTIHKYGQLSDYGLQRVPKKTK